MFICFSVISCTEENINKSSQAKFTYSIEGWESLGSQTLVMMDAKNPSHLNQEIVFVIEVINEDGQIFSKDTTIKFTQSENDKRFELLIETQGIIKDVKISSVEER